MSREEEFPVGAKVLVPAGLGSPTGNRLGKVVGVTARIDVKRADGSVGHFTAEQLEHAHHCWEPDCAACVEIDRILSVGEERGAEATTTPAEAPDWYKRAWAFFDACEDPRLAREQASAQLRDEFINVYALGMLAATKITHEERMAMARELHALRSQGERRAGEPVSESERIRRATLAAMNPEAAVAEERAWSESRRSGGDPNVALLVAFWEWTQGAASRDFAGVETHEQRAKRFLAQRSSEATTSPYFATTCPKCSKSKKAQTDCGTCGYLSPDEFRSTEAIPPVEQHRFWARPEQTARLLARITELEDRNERLQRRERTTFPNLTIERSGHIRGRPEGECTILRIEVPAEYAERVISAVREMTTPSSQPAAGTP